MLARALALWLSAAPAVPVPAVLSAVGVTPSDWKALRSGDVPVRSEHLKGQGGKDAGKGLAFILVNAPWEQAFRIVAAHDKHQEWAPRCEKSEVLSHDLKDGVDHMKVRLTIGVLWKKIVYTLDVFADAPKREMRWALDKSAKNDIADTRGAWRFVELDPQHTVIAYDVAADSGHAVPNWLQDYLTRRDLPGVLESAKKRIESNGAWKK